MRKIDPALLILAYLTLSACGNYSEKKIKEETISLSAQEELSSDFNSIKKIIFSSRCTTCHQQYETYSGVSRELPAIAEAINSDRMPKSGGPLTVSQKNLLTRWIEKGAPENNNGLTIPVNPVVLESNWTSISENIIFPKCLVCHSSQGQAKFLDLSTRQDFFLNRDRIFANGTKLINFEVSENSYLIQILKDPEEPMPPVWSKIPRLTETEIATLNKWIALGLP